MTRWSAASWPMAVVTRWCCGGVLVDGHNRFGICQKHGLPFTTVQNTRFQSMEDVHLWMIEQHLGRRSVSDFQRGAGCKRDILAARKQVEQAQLQREATAPRTSPTKAKTARRGAGPEAQPC